MSVDDDGALGATVCMLVLCFPLFESLLLLDDGSGPLVPEYVIVTL